MRFYSDRLGIWYTWGFRINGSGILSNCAFIENEAEIPKELTLDGIKVKFVGVIERDYDGGSTIELAVFEEVGGESKPRLKLVK